MHRTYADDVKRFGGLSPYNDEDGKKRSLRHETDFLATEVKTDGRGNVISMPLLPKKPCFGRPERFYRASVGSRPWTDDKGQIRPGDTPCTTCLKKSPGVSQACMDLSEERIGSNPEIEAALSEWMVATGTELGQRAFTGSPGQFWSVFLNAIVHHGGWTNVNDDQVRLYSQAKAEDDNKKLRERRKAKRRADRARRRGRSQPITWEYLKALDEERIRRASHLKQLRSLPFASDRRMRWLKSLPDETCDRIADVWKELEQMRRTGQRATNKQIAANLIKQSQIYGATSPSSLAARIGEDIKKRLSRLEDDRAGPPIWPKWVYTDGS